MGSLGTAVNTGNTLSQMSTGALSGSSKNEPPAAAPQTQMGKEDFLRLLITQLRYQDPLKPEDPKDFVAQLAQFSYLEQQLNANKHLEGLKESLNSLKEAQSLAQGVALLGKTVKGSGNTVAVTGGRVGEASFILPLEAQEVTVAIFDSAGKQVRLLNLGARPAGSCSLPWDGKDAGGKTVPDGVYTYQVTAKGKAGQVLKVESSFSGRVEEVSQDSQGVWLKVNGQKVPLKQISTIGDDS